MGISAMRSVGLRGACGYPVSVEIDIANGLPAYSTVGLPDSAVRESRERIVSAVRNSGFHFPPKRITVNLSPAQAKKEGTHFDLPIALALLAASGQIDCLNPDKAPAAADGSEKLCFVGELALDGRLVSVPHALLLALEAKAIGFEGLVLPEPDGPAAEAAGLPAYGARTLREAAELLALPAEERSRLRRRAPPGKRREPHPRPDAARAPDLSDIKGQSLAKRAAEISAAGGHNMLLLGPPGTGKSMLANRLPPLLPPLSTGESVELSRIRVLSGKSRLSLPEPRTPGERPFRAPHHSASAVSLVGGGPAARPGEASLAHGGVLFLDEFSEFSRASLEALREPLEEGRVTVTRVRDTVEYPARFMLVAAGNPCPCGFRGHPQRECLCTPAMLRRYFLKLSGPLIDRIDLQVEMSPLPFKEWAGSRGPAPLSSLAQESESPGARGRVLRAREAQRERFRGRGEALNSRIHSRELADLCPLDGPSLRLLEAASKKFPISARSLDKTVKVSRTIADLALSPRIEAEHVAEALHFRGLERLWTEI